MPSKGNKIPGTFTAIPDVLLSVGFDIYEIVIISSIQSWNRQDKKFYESQARIASEYGCSRATINRRFKGLLDLGILIKGNRRGTGQFEYTVDTNNLMKIIKQRKSQCNLELQPAEKVVTESYNQCNSELQDKTPKTSTKTSFRERESNEDSLSMEMKARIALRDIDI